MEMTPPLPEFTTQTINFLVDDYSTLTTFLRFLSKEEGEVGHQAEVLLRCSTHTNLFSYHCYLRDFVYTRVPVFLIRDFLAQ